MLSAFVGNVKFDDGKANVKLARRQAYLQQYLHRVGKEGFSSSGRNEVSDARDCSALCFTSRTVPSMQLFICMKGDLAMVMVTAYGREEVLRDAQAVGIEDVLIKPVGASVLFDTLMRVLGGEPSGQNADASRKRWRPMPAWPVSAVRGCCWWKTTT